VKKGPSHVREVAVANTGSRVKSRVAKQAKNPPALLLTKNVVLLEYSPVDLTIVSTSATSHPAAVYALHVKLVDSANTSPVPDSRE